MHKSSLRISRRRRFRPHRGDVRSPPIEGHVLNTLDRDELATYLNLIDQLDRLRFARDREEAALFERLYETSLQHADLIAKAHGSVGAMIEARGYSGQRRTLETTPKTPAKADEPYSTQEITTRIHADALIALTRPSVPPNVAQHSELEAKSDVELKSGTVPEPEEALTNTMAQEPTTQLRTRVISKWMVWDVNALENQTDAVAGNRR